MFSKTAYCSILILVFSFFLVSASIAAPKVLKVAVGAKVEGKSSFGGFGLRVWYTDRVETPDFIKFRTEKVSRWWWENRPFLDTIEISYSIEASDHAKPGIYEVKVVYDFFLGPIRLLGEKPIGSRQLELKVKLVKANQSAVEPALKLITTWGNIKSKH